MIETLPRQVTADPHIKHYISEDAWKLIEEQYYYWHDASDEARKAMHEIVRSATRKDKLRHHLKIINSEMSCKQIWQSVTRLRSDAIPNMYALKDQRGRRVALDKRAEATAEYLSEVQWGKPKPRDYTPDEEHYLNWMHSGQMNTQPGNFNTDPITIEELNHVIKEVMRGKASGPDDISFDFVKVFNETLREEILIMLNDWWREESLPDELLQSRVASLYKKGDPQEPGNCRPISLLNAFLKILAAAIKKRIEPGVEHALSETQFGFRKAKSITHAVFIGRRLQDYAERMGFNGALLFLDWGKVFDQVDQTLSIAALKTYDILDKLINLIKYIYRHPTFKVAIDEIDSPWMPQHTGIRQGWPLSPYTFILVMDLIFRIVNKEIAEGMGNDFEKFRGHDIQFTEIIFADDTILFAADGDSLNQLLHTVEHVSGLFGLRLNRNECVVVNFKRILPIDFEDGAEIKEAEHATYLGVTMSNDGDSDKEVHKRISDAKRAWYKLDEFWKR